MCYHGDTVTETTEKCREKIFCFHHEGTKFTKKT